MSATVASKPRRATTSMAACRMRDRVSWLCSSANEERGAPSTWSDAIWFNSATNHAEVKVHLEELDLYRGQVHADLLDDFSLPRGELVVSLSPDSRTLTIRMPSLALATQWKRAPDGRGPPGRNPAISTASSYRPTLPLECQSEWRGPHDLHPDEQRYQGVNTSCHCRTRVIAVAVGDNFGVCLGHSSREHEDRECHHPTTRQVATAAGRTAPCLCVCGVPGQWRRPYPSRITQCR